MDIKLYTQTSQEAPTLYNAESAVLSEQPAGGLEVLANKVVKFLLTSKGSDAFNPDYGGTSLHHKQVQKNYMPMLRLEVLEDIKRCISYVKATEETDADIHIGDIKLLSIDFDTRANMARVRISISDTTGSYALLDIQ